MSIGENILWQGKQFFSGELLLKKAKKQAKLIWLIFACIILYILAGYNTASQQKHLSNLKKEVKDKKFEYLALSAQRMQLTRQSAIVISLQEQGVPLEENHKALIYIER
ncbi:MAG: hypothetical protein MJZ92_01725 [Paludibacteraceae bacterium]|nr:hypothetical protein [Paludibacteraceae bacterium]